MRSTFQSYDLYGTSNESGLLGGVRRQRFVLKSIPVPKPA